MKIIHFHSRTHAYGWKAAIKVANDRARVRGIRQQVRRCVLAACHQHGHFFIADVDGPRES